VSVVASAMVNGTWSILARVWARRVLPEPVGPIRRMLAFLQLHVTGLVAGLDALVVIVDRDREDLLGPLLADHVLVEHVS